MSRIRERCWNPVWNLLELLPDGRGNWMPKHFYDG